MFSLRTRSARANARASICAVVACIALALLLTPGQARGQTSACCPFEGGCVVLTAQECTDIGGTPVASPTCTPAACDGACCLRTGSCSVVSQSDCFNDPEFFFFNGPGSACTPGLCLRVCCRNDGSCVIESLQQCQDAGGTVIFQTTCTPTLCTPGACCQFGGACIIQPEQLCIDSGALRWNGPNTTCTPDACFVACCRHDGTCFLEDLNACFSAGFDTTLGATCTGAPCTGACCLTDGTCTLTIRNQCDLLDPMRVWNGIGLTCQDVLCSVSCCLPDFSCIVTGIGACQFPNIPNFEQPCSPTLCLPPSGACCVMGQACMVTYECDCRSRGGAFFFETACDEQTCSGLVYGACCHGGKPETCTVTAELGCNGNFIPDTTCENSCGTFQFLRACCCYDSCTIVDTAQCNGYSNFNFTTCSPSPCAQGACCNPLTGGCTLLAYPSLCDQNWLPNQTCTPNPCAPPPTGACCDRETDACTIRTFLECVDPPNDDFYRGDNQACTPTICAHACCLPPIYGGRGSVCMLKTRPDCATAGGMHAGLFTSCGFFGNLTTCCAANFNGFGGLSVQDIFDFLAAYFAGNPRADFNQSGLISVQDIFDFLAAYFAGCT